MKQRLQRRERGHAIVETALLCPWIFLLFAAVTDYGFFCCAAIATANAARVAALHTSSAPGTAADASTACSYALAELQTMPNIRGEGSCTCGSGSCTVNGTTGEVVLTVIAQAVTGVDSIAGAATSASQVSVTYTTIPLFPLPFMPGQMILTRTAQMRITEQ